MFSRSALIAALAALGAAAQAPEARNTASEYPAHVEMKGGAVGAENLGHGIMTNTGVLPVDDYLVIEVALYAKDRAIEVGAGQFTLRINGKTPPLTAHSPGMVAASIKYPDWARTPPELTLGAGNAEVIVGGPNSVPRFPGDHRPLGQGRVPNPVPPVPAATSPVQSAPQESIDEVVKRWSLPEGAALRPPVCGYLYFPYRRKLKSVKKLELIYDGPLGAANLNLTQRLDQEDH